MGELGCLTPSHVILSLDKGWGIRGKASFRLDNNIEIGIGLSWPRLNPVKDSGPGGGSSLASI